MSCRASSFLLFNNLLLLVAAALILIGTLYPLFLDALNMGKISVGPPYFNVVFLIPTVPLLFLASDRHARGLEEAKLEETKKPQLVMFAAATVFGLVVPLVAYGQFHVMTFVG